MRISLRSKSTREAVGAISWNLTGMMFSLITGVVSARILAPDDRGLLALALSISSLGYLVSSLGTNSAVRTLQPREVWAGFRTYIQVSAILSFLNLVVLLLITSGFVALGYVGFSDHVIIIAVLGALTFTSNQMLDMFNATGRASLSALANTTGHLTTTLSLLLIFFFLEEFAHLPGVLIAYALSFGARILIMILMARRVDFEYGEADKRSRKKFLKASTRFWGINLGQTLTFRSNHFILGIFSTAYNVGLYAVAATPASLMQVVSNSLGQVAYREAATGELTKRRLFKFLVAGFSITLVYATAMWLLAPWLIPWVFGAAYAEAVPVVRVLVFASLLLSPYAILVRVLAGLNQPHSSSISGLIGFIILAPTLSVLTPEFGAMGAAVGTIIAYAGMLVFVTVRVTSSFARH